MANTIKIPSKNIYNIEQNEIERDNVINSVSTKLTKTVPEDKINEVVFSVGRKVTSTAEDIFPVDNYNGDVYDLGSAGDYYRFASFVAYENKRVLDFVKIYIPIVENNKYVKLDEKTLNSTDENIKTIEYSISGKVETGVGAEDGIFDVTGDFTIDYYKKLKPIYIDYPTQTDKKEAFFTFPEELSVSTKSGRVEMTSSTVQLRDISDLTVTVKTVNLDVPCYEITINRIMVGLTTLEMKLENFEITSLTPPKSCSLYGTYKKYIPERLNITIYGNSYGINLEEVAERYNTQADSENDRIFELKSSELLQVGTETNGTDAWEYLAEKIVSNYNNGKETLVLTCDIADYYDTDENNPTKKIDVKGEKMLFEEGDIVLPMIPSVLENGGILDAPISSKLDKDTGERVGKEFYVVGTDITYNGVPMQKIYLQEV